MNITVKLKTGKCVFIIAEQALALQDAIDHPANASPELRTSASKVEKIYLGKLHRLEQQESLQAQLPYRETE